MEIELRCIDCGKIFEETTANRCDCGGLLEVTLDLNYLRDRVSKKLFDSRIGSRQFPYMSGVWRFRELVNPLIDDKDIISRAEGNTHIYCHPKVSAYTNIKDIVLKHEGENPTGSFKDRGMTSGVSEARRLGMVTVACASTGNTSASMAAYASLAGMKSIVFIPEGMIAYGKLSQSIAYGAKVLQVKGNFDDAMKLVQEASKELKIYLLNSINPWRIEGQKTIIFELLQQLNWETPDWVIVPAGNLGNTSAFGKALRELYEIGFINKVPRIAAIQAEGANPFYSLWRNKKRVLRPVEKPETIATAIKIGNPVSWKKAFSAIEWTRGVVEEVSDQEIMDAKAVVDSAGIGCEPASAASIAGAKKLRESKIIDSNEKVACVITGNILKDPDSTINYHLSKIKDITPRFANIPKTIEPSIGAVRQEVD